VDVEGEKLRHLLERDAGRTEGAGDGAGAGAGEEIPEPVHTGKG
jgi:hypothetical protein